MALALAACGGATDFEDAPGGPAVSSSSVPATTVTTAGPVTTAGRSCASVLTDGLALTRSYNREVRGVAGADEAKYKAEAQVLATEAGRLGCPVPAVVQRFLR